MVEKPAGVTMTAMLFGLAAFVSGGIGIYLQGLRDVWLIGGLIGLIGMFLIVGAVLNVVFAWGIWTLQKWTWQLAYYAVWLHIALSIPAFVAGVGVITFVLFWIIKGYLKDIEEYFD